MLEATEKDSAKMEFFARVTTIVLPVSLGAVSCEALFVDQD